MKKRNRAEIHARTAQALKRLFGNSRLVASSLVELTVATVILVVVTGAALMLYLKVTASGYRLQHLRWELRLSDCARQTKRDATFRNETQPFDDGVLHKRVSVYRHDHRLLLLEITFLPDAGAGSNKSNIHEEKHHYREIVFLPSVPQ